MCQPSFDECTTNRSIRLTMLRTRIYHSTTSGNGSCSGSMSPLTSTIFRLWLAAIWVHQNTRDSFSGLPGDAIASLTCHKVTAYRHASRCFPVLHTDSDPLVHRAHTRYTAWQVDHYTTIQIPYKPRRVSARQSRRTSGRAWLSQESSDDWEQYGYSPQSCWP